MNLRIKKIIRYLIIIVFVTAICLALQVVFIPKIVQHIILSSLADIGLPNAAIEVRSCSWRSAEFTNIELGEDRCACFPAATAEYSVGSLLRGKLHNIQITGGQLSVRIRDGKIDFGELSKIKLKGNQEIAKSPVNRIELHACVLLVDCHEKHIFIPCEGSIINTGLDWTSHNLQLNFQGTPVQAEATYHGKEKTVVFSLDRQKFDLRTLAAALPANALNLPERWEGQADIELKGDISIGNGDALLNASVENGWLKTSLGRLSIDSEQTSCKLKIVLENQFRLKDVNGTLDVGALKLGDENTKNVHFAIKKDEDRLLFSGEAQGDRWQLKAISASLPSKFLGYYNRDNFAEISCEFSGYLPVNVSHKVFDKGFDISKLGPVNFSGRVLTDWPELRDFELVDGRLTLEPGTINVMRGGAVLRGFSGNLAVHGNYGRDKGNGNFVLGDSELRFDSAGTGEINAETTRLFLRGAEGRNAISFTGGDTTSQVRVSLDALASGTSLRTSGKSLMAEIGDSHLILDANIDSFLKDIDGTLTANRVRWYSKHPKGIVDVGKMSLNFNTEPSIDNSSVVKASLTIDEATLLNGTLDPVISLDRKTLKTMFGSFDLKTSKGKFAWQLPIQEGVALNITSSVDLSKKQVSGSVRASCEGFRLGEEQVLTKILTDSTGLAIDGDFSLKAELDWAQEQLTSRVTILTTNATASDTNYEVVTEGIEGAVTLTNFLPLSTPGNQMLKIEKLKFGKLELNNGLIAFRIEDDPMALFIERTEWEWLGGRLYAYAVRIDPNHSEIEMRCFAENIDVGLLLSMALGEGAVGEGKLFGTIPIRISTSETAGLSLGEGFLHSTTARGHWMLKNRASSSAVWRALEQQLGQAINATGRADSRERILKGLLDLEYDKFKIDFFEQDDGLTARISMKGHSGNIEFEEIVVIIRGIDEDLRSIIGIKPIIGEHLKRTMEKEK